MAAGDREAELTAYCGDCLRYASHVPDLARDLRNELVKVKFKNYASVKSEQVKEFEHCEAFLQVLDATAKLKCHTPCRSGGDGCLESCEIKECVLAKSFEGCWECGELESCNKFEFLKPFSRDAPRENAKKIKEHGLDKWATHRSKFYAWL